jgi:hypothetical protein
MSGSSFGVSSVLGSLPVLGPLFNIVNFILGLFGGGGSTSSSDANVLPENITGTAEAISAATGSSDPERNTTNPSSDTPITITSIKANPDNASQLWVKYEEVYYENGKYKTYQAEKVVTQNTDGTLDEGEFKSVIVNGKESLIIVLNDKNGEPVTIEGEYNESTGDFEQTSTTQASSDSAESNAVTDLYDFRWAYNSNGEQVLRYRPKGDDTDIGTVLTLDVDGGSLAENERSTIVWNSDGSSSSYKVNIGGTTYSVPVGVIEVVTATTWGLSGENIQNNEGSETLIATDSTTTTTAANLITAVASAFADTGSTIASSINTADTTPTTLAATG